MNLERTREFPFRVAGSEESFQSKINGLDVHGRIDRIDLVETPDGPQSLIIDYKTGKSVDSAKWKAPDIAEPQLPLYALCAADIQGAQGRVDGIAFAHLSDGHHRFVGKTRWSDGLIHEGKSKQLSFEEAIQTWRADLELATELFLSGRAEVKNVIGSRSNDSAYAGLTRGSADIDSEVADDAD